MTDAVWNGGLAETRKIAALAETFGVPLVLHNVAGPICHAACMHLGAHIPNLYYVESSRAFYKEIFPALTDLSPSVHAGCLDVPDGSGLGVTLRETALDRDDVIRQVSEGPGLAAGDAPWATTGRWKRFADPSGTTPPPAPPRQDGEGSQSLPRPYNCQLSVPLWHILLGSFLPLTCRGDCGVPPQPIRIELRSCCG